MKNYNKILEAVNRGILIALDDFDDVELVLHVKSRLINHRDYTKEYLDLLKYEVVDLGLPSGTLWCKYNLGVDPNLLSKAEDWYGDYYAWGELEPNKTNEDGEIHFKLDNYKFGNAYNELTKYCNNPKIGLNGYIDNLNLLLPEDDAAYQFKKWHNFKFHIPTREQCEELIKYTKNYFVNNYDPNKTVHNSKDDGGIQGLNGRIFEGKNGNLLFIPVARYRNVFGILSVGSDCYLWSSSLYLDNPNYAYILYFNSDSVFVYGYYRYGGCSVCPVLY